MKAVILAAGLGTRMQKYYPGVPKVMLSVIGKPLIQDQIEHLKKFGVKNFYINLHFLPEKIKKFLSNGKKFGVKITYSFEPKILGTSGALINFKKYLNETVIVLYGDIFTRVDFNKYYKYHKVKKSLATLLIHETDHPQDSDLVEIDQNGRIINFHFSPHKNVVTTTNLSSAAIYILEPGILKYLPTGFSDFIEDFFPTLLPKNVPMYGYICDEYSKDLGTPERYEKVKKDIIRFKLK